jgi:hypothetical protein
MVAVFPEMAFPPDSREKCLAIIDDLLAHPMAGFFSKPVDPIADEVPDYFDVIQHPSDLGTVRTKLSNDRYRSLQDFKRDINLIWENAATYNGRPSLPVYIADELSRLFQKRMSVLEDPPTDAWINDFLKARSVLCKLFRSAPKGLAFTFAKTGPVEDVEVPRKRTRVSQQDLSFFHESEALFSERPSLREGMLKVVKDAEPSIDTDTPRFMLDLASISSRTLNILKQWIAEVRAQKPE